MKIIGVEFRVAFQNQIVGNRGIELFLHPCDIDCPDELGELNANLTVHTSVGDRNMACGLRNARYGEVDQAAVRRISEHFLMKYGTMRI